METGGHATRVVSAGALAVRYNSTSMVASMSVR